MAIADPDYIQIIDTQPSLAASQHTEAPAETPRSHTAAVMDTDMTPLSS